MNRLIQAESEPESTTSSIDCKPFLKPDSNLKTGITPNSTPATKITNITPQITIDKVSGAYTIKKILPTKTITKKTYNNLFTALLPYPTLIIND